MAEETQHWIAGGPNRLAAVLHDAGSESWVVMAHGFTGHKAESSWLFTTTARAFAEAGLSVLRFDFAGSGDSEGAFEDMTPATEIADLNRAIDWARGRGARRLGLLGLSMGGGVSICAAAARADVAALVTWSPVPDFRAWSMMAFPASAWEGAMAGKSFAYGAYTLGPRFFLDCRQLDIPGAYARLQMPKMIVEGTNDLQGFQSGNYLNHLAAGEPKRMHLIPGGDHVFNSPEHRREAVRASLEFFLEFLKPTGGRAGAGGAA
jgi:alpha/beta superfamily hydrolase